MQEEIDKLYDKIRELQTKVIELREKLDNQEEDVNTWPKEDDEYFYVDCDRMEADYSFWCDDIIDNNRNDLGNIFRTEEEAEKAVEKLKALKRLKDKGFEVLEWKWLDDTGDIWLLTREGQLWNRGGETPDDVLDDLNILFNNLEEEE